MKGVIGVVILHFPGSGLADCLRSYLHEVDELLLIDNSVPATRWLGSLAGKKITIISNQHNAGIAAALNTAARYAIGKGARWLLTMDQDSTFSHGHASRLINFAAHANEDVAICCPAYHHEATRSTQLVRYTMTSGSMLNLTAFQQCGPFDERLFIDSVDHEYCLRLRKAGWKIVKTDAVLQHQPGTKTLHGFSGIVVHVTHHPASRHYFMARNRLVVMFRYLSFDPKFFLHELFEYPKQLTRIVIFEEQKLARLNYMFRGIFDFLSGRFPDHA